MAKTLEERLKALQTEKDRRDKAVGVSFQRAMRAAARIKREDVVFRHHLSWSRTIRLWTAVEAIALLLPADVWDEGPRQPYCLLNNKESG